MANGIAGNERQFLRALLDAAVAAASPARVVPPHLPAPPKGRHRSSSAPARPSAAMARAVEDNWPGPLSGLVVTRYGHAVPCRRDRGRRGRASAARRGGRGCRAADARDGRASGSRRSGSGADVRRRLVASDAAGDGPDARRPARRSTARCSSPAPTSPRSTRCASICRRSPAAGLPWPPTRRRCWRWSFPTSPATIRPSSRPARRWPTRRRFADARAVLARYRIAVSAAVAAHLATCDRGDAEARRPASGAVARRRRRLAGGEPGRGRTRRRGPQASTPLILGDAIEGEAREVGARHGRDRAQLRSDGASRAIRRSSCFPAARPR